MPYWGQEMYKLHNGSVYISSYSTSAIYKKNASKFTQIWQGAMFESQVGAKSYTVVTNAMIPLGNNATVSAKDYFNGLSTSLTAEDWANGFMPQ